MEILDGATTMERKLMDRAEAAGVPLTGSLELLPLCNMNCDMCYVRLSHGEMQAQGRLRSGAEWLSLGQQMRQAGALFLLLTGGEPLLHPDFKEIYLGLKQMGMILTVNTNGTLIDGEWADFFSEHIPRRINITLYGGSEKTYDRLCHYPAGYSQVIAAVAHLRRRGVDVKLAGSVTPGNVEDVDAMLEAARTLDVPIRMDTYMMPAARERTKPFSDQNRLAPEAAAAARIRSLRSEMGEALFSAYRKETLERIEGFVPREPKPCPVSCHGGKCAFTVNWQGMLRPCVVMTEPEVPVFETGFTDGWRQVWERFVQVQFSPKCGACALRTLCRTCAAAARLETGHYTGTPEYLCRYAAESLRLLRLAGKEA